MEPKLKVEIFDRAARPKGRPCWQGPLVLLLCLGPLPLAYRFAGIALGSIRPVIPGQIYRSGQPSARELKAWIRGYGLRTIVDLRGPDAPFAAQEYAIASSMGVRVEFVDLSAFHLPERSELLALIDVIRHGQRPILFHCWHGIDRAGFASALAAWLSASQPYHKAKWQAYVPPGPWKHKHGSSHISDTFSLYEDFCRSRGLDMDDPTVFIHWAASIYDPNEPPAAAARSQHDS